MARGKKKKLLFLLRNAYRRRWCRRVSGLIRCRRIGAGLREVPFLNLWKLGDLKERNLDILILIQ